MNIVCHAATGTYARRISRPLETASETEVLADVKYDAVKVALPRSLHTNFCTSRMQRQCCMFSANWQQLRDWRIWKRMLTVHRDLTATASRLYTEIDFYAGIVKFTARLPTSIWKNLPHQEWINGGFQEWPHVMTNWTKLCPPPWIYLVVELVIVGTLSFFYSAVQLIQINQISCKVFQMHSCSVRSYLL